MGARAKLNSAYLMGNFILALLAGGATGSGRDPDKPDHQPFDRDEGGIGGGAHGVVAGAGG